MEIVKKKDNTINFDITNTKNKITKTETVKKVKHQCKVENTQDYQITKNKKIARTHFFTLNKVTLSPWLQSNKFKSD